MLAYFCFVKQKTAYEMRISDWSSDVCSSDLTHYGSQRCRLVPKTAEAQRHMRLSQGGDGQDHAQHLQGQSDLRSAHERREGMRHSQNDSAGDQAETHMGPINGISELIGQHGFARDGLDQTSSARSEEHTSELQSLMRISYDVF